MHSLGIIPGPGSPCFCPESICLDLEEGKVDGLLREERQGGSAVRSSVGGGSFSSAEGEREILQTQQGSCGPGLTENGLSPEG